MTAEAVTIRAAAELAEALRAIAGARGNQEQMCWVKQTALAALARWEAREPDQIAQPDEKPSDVRADAETIRAAWEHVRVYAPFWVYHALRDATARPERSEGAQTPPAALGVRLREVEAIRDKLAAGVDKHAWAWLAQSCLTLLWALDDATTALERATDDRNEALRNVRAAGFVLNDLGDEADGAGKVFAQVCRAYAKTWVRAEDAEGALAAAVAESARRGKALTTLGEVAELMERVGSWLIANDGLIAASPEAREIAEDAAACAVRLEAAVREALAGGAAAPPPDENAPRAVTMSDRLTVAAYASKLLDNPRYAEPARLGRALLDAVRCCGEFPECSHVAAAASNGEET